MYGEISAPPLPQSNPPVIEPFMTIDEIDLADMPVKERGKLHQLYQQLSKLIPGKALRIKVNKKTATYALNSIRKKYPDRYDGFNQHGYLYVKHNPHKNPEVYTVPEAGQFLKPPTIQIP